MRGSSLLYGLAVVMEQTKKPRSPLVTLLILSLLNNVAGTVVLVFFCSPEGRFERAWSLEVARKFLGKRISSSGFGQSIGYRDWYVLSRGTGGFRGFRQ